MQAAVSARAATMYAQPGRFAATIVGFGDTVSNTAAFTPSAMSLGLARTRTRAASPTASSAISATTIGGMRNTAMIAAVAYARGGVLAAITVDTAPSSAEASTETSR